MMISTPTILRLAHTWTSRHQEARVAEALNGDRIRRHTARASVAPRQPWRVGSTGPVGIAVRQRYRYSRSPRSGKVLYLGGVGRRFPDDLARTIGEVTYPNRRTPDSDSRRRCRCRNGRRSCGRRWWRLAKVVAQSNHHGRMIEVTLLRRAECDRCIKGGLRRYIVLATPRRRSDIRWSSPNRAPRIGTAPPRMN